MRKQLVIDALIQLLKEEMGKVLQRTITDAHPIVNYWQTWLDHCANKDEMIAWLKSQDGSSEEIKAAWATIRDIPMYEEREPVVVKSGNVEVVGDILEVSTWAAVNSTHSDLGVAYLVLARGWQQPTWLPESQIVRSLKGDA